MPITEVTVVRICGKCHLEVETSTVKKDNLRLFSDQLVWCPNCQAEQPEGEEAEEVLQIGILTREEAITDQSLLWKRG